MATDTDIEPIKNRLLTLRGEAVIVDRDLAAIYGVTTSALNQAVARNPGRFPEDFSFVADVKEVAILKSQNVISSGHGGHRKLPRFFTEHGALMASTLLRSESAVAMSVFVIRAFVRMRQEVAANQAILKRLAEIDRNLMGHNQALRDIYRKLVPLLTSPPDPPKRRIGFQTDEQ